MTRPAQSKARGQVFIVSSATCNRFARRRGASKITNVSSAYPNSILRFLLTENVCYFKLGFGVHNTADTVNPFRTIVYAYPNSGVLAGTRNERVSQRMTKTCFFTTKLRPTPQVPSKSARPRKYNIVISADHHKSVPETNEENNRFEFTVLLNGDCRGVGLTKPGLIKR